MRLHNLVKISANKSKRVGRGLSSGKGKTAGRGTKGQKSRSGYNLPRRFEGGQTPLIQRLPKTRGFKSRQVKPLVISVAKIEQKYREGEEVNFKTLKEKSLIDDAKSGVKIVGPGQLTKKLKFKDVKLTPNLLKDLKKLAVQTAKPVVKKTTKPIIKKTVKSVKSTTKKAVKP